MFVRKILGLGYHKILKERHSVISHFKNGKSLRKSD